VFYLLHGDDEFSRSEQLVSLQRRMGDPVMGELNTTRLDGSETTLGELQHHCSTVPFFSERRLIVVDGFLAHLQQTTKADKRRELAESLIDYIPAMPATTRLVFLESAPVDAQHPLRRLIERDASMGRDLEFRIPQGRRLEQWISRRVESRGGTISAGATVRLSASTGGNLRLLSQEIDKLLSYVNRDRSVTEDDVHLLVTDVREASVFDMVDALGRRDGAAAMQLLHLCIDAGAHPLALQAMVARQIRILIQVKELAQAGADRSRVAKTLGLHSFVVRKALEQERNFSMARLVDIHRRLLEADVAIKTGLVSGLLALDMMIAQVSSDHWPEASTHA
jgi:DNA polymerase-3 subunit delta